MKSHLPSLAAAATAVALLAAVSPARADLTFNFQEKGHNIALTTTETFRSVESPSYHLTASGTSNLYAKSNPGDESGLGLTNDSSNAHEITAGNHIDFNIHDLKASFAIKSFNFILGSVTSPDKYEIDGVGLNGATVLGIGTSDGAFNISQANLAKYDILRVGGVAGNVLVDAISITGAVPEPASLAMTALGIAAALGGYRLRRRKATMA